MNSVDRALAAVLAAVVTLPCGACSQRWTFARPEDSSPHTAAWLGQSEAVPQRAQSGASLRSAASHPTTQQQRHTVNRPDVAAAGYHHEVGVPGVVWAGGMGPEATFVAQRQPAFQPLPPVLDQQPWLHATAERTAGGKYHPQDRVQAMFHQTWCNICQDHANYYCRDTLSDLGWGVVAAAPFANSSLDADLQNWYQREVRTSVTDRQAAFWKTFGEGQIFIPAFIGLGLAGSLFEEESFLGTTGQFGTRVTRSYLVGAPPMVFMQYCLGGSRPDETSVGSQWKPFADSNAVSGHAFVGAVPFITAAQMCENRWGKAALYLCSTFTAWSRVNDHDHYPTQAVLGWWMAYLACRSVERTEQGDGCVSFTPLVTPEMAGVGMVMRR